MADTRLIGVRKEYRNSIRQNSGFEPNEQNLQIFNDFVKLPR